jgi:hypothetical protein
LIINGLWRHKKIKQRVKKETPTKAIAFVGVDIC